MHPAQQPVVLPAAVAEAAIALRRRLSSERPAATRDKLHAETARVAGGTTRMASQAGDRPPGRPRLEEPAHAAVFEHGVGEHHVETRPGSQAETRVDRSPSSVLWGRVGTHVVTRTRSRR